MAIPAYLWLKDEQGNNISGSVKVSGREGSIEVLELSHNIYIPTDSDTGELTGTRKHSPVTIGKACDASSPYLFKACCRGQKFTEAVFCLYKIDDSGQEVEYYKYLLEGVKISSFSPGFPNVKDPGAERIPHMETVTFGYEKITHIHIDGNLSYYDSWLERS
ncbi:Hcp family type VI secretion system effector [Gynuella sunshinyii]|uniref:Hemolysin-coregulated protein (Uncharacterized) n=1 Tax=Gynuella sunshinyii YC6258 TaxID=1445510 RepID=A0A0C5VMU5_9GAMM|nr:Hcp family type VI secretion system effector [Gynuella sunshinyii]AJQ96052.1 hemolysin-coregulated protein (uncharacterized) [Gynuella sunshinyii YC6258]